jgi:hypothetical protein
MEKAPTPKATMVPPPARPSIWAPEAHTLPRPDPTWAQPRAEAKPDLATESRGEWRQRVRQTMFPSAPPVDWAALEFRLTEAEEDEARLVEAHLKEVQRMHYRAVRDARRDGLYGQKARTAEEVYQQAVAADRAKGIPPANRAGPHPASYAEAVRGGPKQPQRQRPPQPEPPRGPDAAEAGPGPARVLPLPTFAEEMVRYRTLAQQAEWAAASMDRNGPVHLGLAALPAYWPKQWDRLPRTGSAHRDLSEMAWRVRRSVTSLAEALYAAQKAATHVRGQLDLLASLAIDIPGAAPPRARKPAPVGAQRRKPAGC